MSTPKHRRGHQRLALFLACLFLFNTVFPMGFAAAQVLLMAKPGLGVSRVPLSAMAFDAPGFGDLAEAVNLANGNLYVAVDALSTNTRTNEEGAETSDTIGNSGWNFTPQLKLSGFSNGITQAPDTFTLESGDQSTSVFERVAPSVCGDNVPNLDFDTAPSWIERYSHSTLRCNRAFYRLSAEPGLSYAETYIVLKTGGDSLAHYYALDGTRTTFYQDSHFAAFSQTLHQQYQGALKNDPEGTGNSPKTTYSYEDTTFGRIASVTDAYGRVTKYKWATEYSAQVLTDVYYLLADGVSTSKAARSIHLDYTKINAHMMGDLRIDEQVVVEKVTYTAPDRFKGDGAQSRNIKFTYYNDGFLKTTARQTPEGDLVTTYAYDNQYRVLSVAQTGLPTQFYSYDGASQDYEDGTLVTVTQGRQASEGNGLKRSEYHFDQANKLRKKVVKDVHSDGTVKELAWDYAYYKSGNVGLVKEPSGRYTHFGYDARGNIESESVYLDKEYYKGKIRLPVTVALESPADRLTYGTNDTFTLKATVGRDELKRGVRWSYVDDLGKEIPFKLGAAGVTMIPAGPTFIPVQTSVPVSLTAVSTRELVGEYEVTATFKVGGNLPKKRRVRIKARSNLMPGHGAEQFVNLSPRIKRVQIKTHVNKLIAAPNCVRPPNEIHKPVSECKARRGAYGVFNMSATKAVVENWVTNEARYKGVDLSIQNYTYRSVSGAPAPSVDAAGNLRIPWHTSLAKRAIRGEVEQITVRVTSRAEPSNSHTEEIPVSFFAIDKMKTQEAGNWDIPRVGELGDGSTYQYAVDVYNSPQRDLKVKWRVQHSNRGYFKRDQPGCFRTYGRGPGVWDTRIYASVEGPDSWTSEDDFPQVSVDQYVKIKYVTWWWDISRECSTNYKAGHGTRYGFGNTDVTFAPQSQGAVTAQSTSSQDADTFAKDDETVPKLIEDDEQDLANEPKSGWLYQTKFKYDRDNRLKETSSPKPLTDNIGGLNHAYENLTETITPAFYGYTSRNQTFEAVSSLTRTVKVGTATSRTTVDSFKTSGLLESSKLMWNGEYRKESYSYYAPGDNVALTVPSSDGYGSASVEQYGDMLKQITTTSSHEPSLSESADTRTQTFAYDALGHMVKETLSGLVSDVSPLVKRETRTVERAFNGYGQPVWERVSLGDTVASEQGLTYHPSGYLLSEWAGTAENLTTYSYYAGNKVGLVERVQRGVAGETSGLATVRDRVDYDYDTFRRLASETVVVSDSQKYKTSYRYDTLDRITETTLPDPDASTITTTYDLYGEVATLDEPRVRRSYTHNSLGYLTGESVTPKDGVSDAYSVTYKHDVYGRVVYALPSDASIVTNEADRASLFRYDTEGNLRCEIGPVMRSASHDVAAKDERRPGVSYTYDALGRKESETRVLYGELDVLSSCNLMNDEANIATTTFDYDGFGNLERVTDAEGYQTESAFDAAGQAFLSRRQVKGSEYAEVWTAFDGAGRPVEVKDPLGYTRESRYDRLGNVLEEVNEAGYTTKRFRYTKDGLLESVAEPQMTAGARDNAPSDSTAMITTQINVYGQQRPYPTEIYRAHMDDTPTRGATGSVSGGTKTGYSYDWAGRVTKTKLADDAIIEQDYDLAGNVTELTSADGFTTSYTYDYASRLLSETKHARGGNEVDSAAGLEAGLRSSYVYDVSGNLVREKKQGLITTYVYNSIGEVVAESRPKRNAPSTLFKRYAYRLDGAQTAATSYTYADNGTLAQEQRSELGGGLSRFTAGSAETFGLDKLGRVMSERTEGVRPEQTTPPADSSQEPSPELEGVLLEKLITYERNGLGLATKRILDGRSAPDVYAILRDPATGGFLKEGASGPVVGYTTHYKYSARGELLEQYDAIGFDSWTSTKTDNHFEYTYTATGKQKSAWRDLSIRVLRQLEANQKESVLLAATKGSVTSRYNERDLLKSTTVKDRAAEGKNALETNALTQNTTYTYYKDGSKQEVKVDDETTTYQYDARSRLVRVEDANGTTVPSYAGNQSGGEWARYTPVGTGSATVTTQYNGDTRIETVTWSSGCSYTQTSTYALEIYKYKEVVENTCSVDGEATPNPTKSESTTLYTATGLITDVSGVDTYLTKLPNDAVNDYAKVSSSYGAPDDDAEIAFSYDDFNQLVTKKQKSMFNSLSFKEWYEDTEVADYYDANCKCYPEEKVMKKRNVSVKATTDLKSESFTYTEDGHRLSETVTTSSINPETGNVIAGKGDTKEVRYLLDAVGNRRGVQGGKYDGFIKRYNADGQVSMFYHYSGVSTTDGGRGTYSDFLYDPAGDLALSATSGVYQEASNRSGVLFARDYNSVYTSEGDVQLLRKRWSTSNTRNEEPTEEQTLWNHTFSLADGVHSQVEWNAVELFEVAAPSRPLAAPTTSISERLGVTPAEVIAPDTTLPDLESGEVLPPVEEEKTPAPAEDESVNTQASSWTGNTLSALEPIDGGKGKPTAQLQWGSEAVNDATAVTETSEATPSSTAAPSGPQEPSSVLPDVLNTTDALDVVAPKSLDTSLPSVGDANEVLPPGVTAPPGVGAAPSDGPLDIVPPAEIQPPNVPVIGTTPDAITEVAPPLGWQAENASIDAFSGRSTGPRTCEVDSRSGTKICGTPSNVAKALRQIEEGKLVLTGGNKVTLEVSVAQLQHQANLFTTLASKYILDGLDAKEVETILEKAHEVGDLEMSIRTLQMLNLHIATEQLTGYELGYLAADLTKQAFNAEYAGLKTAYMNTFSAYLRFDFDDSGGFSVKHLASNSADFIPFLGDAKGVVEAIIGYQIGTNEKLTGATRWLGLFGLIGLAELKYGAKAADLLRLSRMSSKVGARLGRFADEAPEVAQQVVERAMRCFRNSFSEDTPVATPAGAVAIGTLVGQEGTEVTSYNEETGQVEPNIITEVHVHDDPVTIDLTVDFDLTDEIPGELIETTPEHPFYVLGEWVDAEDLKVGMPLSTFEGTDLVYSGTVTGVERVEETQTMYNLTVDTAHTFFVGEGQWLVHNTNCGNINVFNGLNDLDSFATADVLDLAQDFLGPNPGTLGDGVYVSSSSITTVNGQDVFGMFRIAPSDIAGAHPPSVPHANFQLVKQLVKPDGKVSYVQYGANNKHIIFSDNP